MCMTDETARAPSKLLGDVGSSGARLIGWLLLKASLAALVTSVHVVILVLRVSVGLLAIAGLMVGLALMVPLVPLVLLGRWVLRGRQGLSVKPKNPYR